MSNTYTLTNPQNGNLAFKLFSFEDNHSFDHIQRLHYYALIWVQEGAGTVNADFSEYSFVSNTLFAFSPYQPFMFNTNVPMKGIVINFHPDFFCIHKHQAEVACNGVLFNNIYQAPFVSINASSQQTFLMLLEQIKMEFQDTHLAQQELLIAYLKIFLITASRLKTQQQSAVQPILDDAKEPFILQHLKDAIEQYFKQKHAPSQYADLLNISPKALAKLTKTHFNKTLTDLIAERIMIEAKRELYLTNKSIKEIAYELGYEDEYYFSRFFKNNASISPQLYRETVGFGKAMLS